MLVKNYGVWVARPVSFTAQTVRDDDKSLHITLNFKNSLTQGFTRKFTAAINVKSIGDDSRLVYWFAKDLPQAVTVSLKEFDPGFHFLEEGQLDYSRDGRPDLQAGTILEHDIPGPSNDILDKVKPILTSAINNEGTV